MDFYAMDEGRRKTFLDDGLHMTEYGYDQLAGHIANYITPNSHATRKL
jgi:lysophospholipase L1-like esterase